MVALASAVRVLVIDCTVIGASPPTSTDPTRILRVGRRWIARQGRTCWISEAVMAVNLSHSGLKPKGPMLSKTHRQDAKTPRRREARSVGAALEGFDAGEARLGVLR